MRRHATFPMLALGRWWRLERCLNVPRWRERWQRSWRGWCLAEHMEPPLRRWFLRLPQGASVSQERAAEARWHASPEVRLSGKAEWW